MQGPEPTDASSTVTLHRYKVHVTGPRDPAAAVSCSTAQPTSPGLMPFCPPRSARRSHGPWSFNRHHSPPPPPTVHARLLGRRLRIGSPLSIEGLSGCISAVDPSAGIALFCLVHSGGCFLETGWSRGVLESLIRGDGSFGLSSILASKSRVLTDAYTCLHGTGLANC